MLLSATDIWAASIRSEAKALRSLPFRYARSALDAVRHLSAADNPFSHLLVEPHFAGDLLDTMVELTSGESASGTSLILLGAKATRPPQANPARTRIVDPSQPGWLARALERDENAEPAQCSPSVDELRMALAADRITARYQPIVRFANRVPIGLEVLARLEHQTSGTLPPDLFVPQIEAAGLGWPLTRAVVIRAFEDWGRGRLAALGLSIGLNFPLDVLLIPGTVEWLEALRTRSGIPARSIVVELTESQPVSHIDQLHAVISNLRQIGYWVAIDDVGPNIRDHRELLNLPFTTLKLDRDVVQDGGGNPGARDFLVSTIASARYANLRIVAEGVGDRATWDRMAELGADFAQGFMVGRPLPASAVKLWLADWRKNHMD